MKRVYLIRHGDIGTEAYYASYSSEAKLGLNERGRKQAQLAADFLADKGVDFLAASPMLRASETADIIGKKIGLKPEEWRGFEEVHVGDFPLMKKIGATIGTAALPGFLRETIFKSSVYINFLTWFAGIKKTGEKPAELLERIRSGYDRMNLAPAKTMAVVSHGYFISALSLLIMKRAGNWRPLLENYWVENCSITVINFDEDGNAEIDTFAGADHLKDSDL